MQTLRVKNIILFAAVLFCSVNSYAQFPGRKIDSLLLSRYPPEQPGIVISIKRNNDPVFAKAYGMADLFAHTSLTLHSRFNIGSLTKQFTAVAILLLEAEKKISLNDSLGKFFPDLHPSLSALTIEQLLSHSSGIPDHYGFTDTSRIKHATDRDVLEAIRKADTLYFTAGTHYRYSNTAYCLLGDLVEKVSGMSYPAFMKKKVFDPAGLSETSVFRWKGIIPERVYGYEPGPDGEWRKSDAAESIFFSTEADGGIYTSMPDFQKWCDWMEENFFAQRGPVRKAWQAHTPVDSLHQLSYGYGWFIYKTADSGLVYHSGSNGGFRSFVMLIPRMKYRIAIFSNRPDIDLENLARNINAILGIPDNSFTNSSSLESFLNSWPIFAPCKETSSYSKSFIRNLNVKDMALN